jgi:hypothetical protein
MGSRTSRGGRSTHQCIAEGRKTNSGGTIDRSKVGSDGGAALMQRPHVITRRRDGEALFRGFAEQQLDLRGQPRERAEALLDLGVLYAMSAYHGASNKRDPLYAGVRTSQVFSGELALGDSKLMDACHDHMIEREFVPLFGLLEVPVKLTVRTTLGGYRVQGDEELVLPITNLLGVSAAVGIMRHLTNLMDRPPHQWPQMIHGPRTPGQRTVWLQAKDAL